MIKRKKKMLIVITDLGLAGAQKSLVSFCNVLFERYPDLFDIDLMILTEEGEFISQLPSKCRIIPTPKELICMKCSIGGTKFWKNISIKGLSGRIMRIGLKKWYYLKNKELNDEQIQWLQWKPFIGSLPIKYDIAMSYIDGTCNYYVIEKVKAVRKILWVHNEYEKLGYNAEFDRSYFQSADAIATISDICVANLVKYFPDMKKKIIMVENITSEKMIYDLADEFFPEEYKNYNGNKILSIGRLTTQKNFQLAINVARILKEKKIDFIWYIIGEGTLKEELFKEIEKCDVQKNVVLLGSRRNPYPYIKYADFFVQTSKFEGKSIVLDEAKILKKIIVSTNYDTVYDTIENQKNGIIANMTPEDVANAILLLLTNSVLKNSITGYLENTVKGNEEVIDKYIECLLGVKEIG